MLRRLLSMNGNFPNVLSLSPFVLSLSKDSDKIFATSESLIRSFSC